jgi:TRAP-type C4-dicarboxylate transport system permease small subunit
MQKSEGERKQSFLIFDNSLVFFSTLCLSGIVLINLVNIVSRFLFNSPLFWAIEVSSILAVWFTFIVFGINYKEKQHFKIDMIVNIFKGKLKAMHEIFADLVLVVILCFILYSGFFSFFRNYKMTLPATEISSSIALYLPLILGSITYLVFIVKKYIRTLTKRS